MAASPAPDANAAAEAKVTAMLEEVERLEAAVESAITKEAETKDRMTTAQTACGVADEKLKVAEVAFRTTAASLSAATAERAGAQAKVADSSVEVAALRKKVRRFGGSGAGTGEAELPTFDTPAEIERDEAAVAAVQSLSERELGEVRKLSRPPQIVRRALELVQVLIKAAEGKDPKIGAPGEEAEWSELQQMLAKPDFIKRVLALNALDLSQRPQLLDKISNKWPSMRDAVGTTAAPRWKKALVGSKLKFAKATSTVKLAAGAPTPPPLKALEEVDEGDADLEDGASEAAEASEVAKPAAAAAPGGESLKHGAGRGARGFAAAVGAAAAEASPDGPALTVEAVEYASRPCGAIFRWCAAVLAAAMSMGKNREIAQAVLDAALAKLAGLQAALVAAEMFSHQMSEADQTLKEKKEAAASNLSLAQGMRMTTSAEHSQAVITLDEARKAAANASKIAKLEGDAYARRKEEADRKKREKQESERLAAAELERETRLAAPPKPPNTSKLCWLHEHQLDGVTPLEFALKTATLPPDAHVSLARVAKELQGMPTLKLHIAGHAQSDEDPKLSSQRAQAVGAALIALGAMPSRLRAKGYGASVGLSAAMKARLRVKTDRRVGVHAISELGTRYGIEFAAKASDISDRSLEMLKGIAALLEENRGVRLSVEGHTDDKGDAAENAKLSVQRAQAVCRTLDSFGVDIARLVPHGFGATLPLSDNTSEDGRQRNRRVQFLVIPNVNDVRR